MNRMTKLFLNVVLLLFIISTNTLAQSEKPMGFKDLQQFLANINQTSLIETKLSAMGYHRKFNGIYISNTMLTPKKPKHWLHVNQLGSYSNITFATADKTSWERVLFELKKQAKPVKFDTGTSEIGYRYRFAGYEVKTYKPLNGVNLNLNNLYQVVVMKR